jgi:hypothetical protein
LKSILDRIRKYLGSTGRRNRDRAQPEPSELPPERTSGIRTFYEDPYAEMRRVLAITMLLG